MLYRVPGVPGGQGVGLEGPMGSKGGPRGSQVVMGWAYRLPEGQGVGLQGPRGSRSRPVGCQGVNRVV